MMFPPNKCDQKPEPCLPLTQPTGAMDRGMDGNVLSASSTNAGSTLLPMGEPTVGESYSAHRVASLPFSLSSSHCSCGQTEWILDCQMEGGLPSIFVFGCPRPDPTSTHNNPRPDPWVQIMNRGRGETGFGDGGRGAHLLDSFGRP